MIVTFIRQGIILIVMMMTALAHVQAAPDHTQIKAYQDHYKAITGKDIPLSIVSLVSRQPDFNSPVNELPFYGFRSTNPAMMEADRSFVELAMPMKDAAVTRGLQLAWAAFYKRDFAEAARRFNQVFLLDPEQSQIAHGHAIIMFERFGKDGTNRTQLLKHIDELFSIAAAGKNPAPPMMKDHALIKIRAGELPDAIVILEKEVARFPENQELISDLAYANLANRNVKRGCELGAKADPRHPYVVRNLLPILQQAGCPRPS